MLRQGKLRGKPCLGAIGTGGKKKRYLISLSVESYTPLQKKKKGEGKKYPSPPQFVTRRGRNETETPPLGEN